MTANQLKYQEIAQKERLGGRELDIRQQEADIKAKDLLEKIRHNFSDEEIRRILADVEAGKLDFDKYKYLDTEQKLMLQKIKVTKDANVRDWLNMALTGYNLFQSSIEGLNPLTSIGKAISGVGGTKGVEAIGNAASIIAANL